MTIIYHITTRAAWQQAQTEGIYRMASLLEQGFIHFSTRDQVVPVANAVFRGQSDLVLLRVDTEKLDAPLKYELPDSAMPHVTAPDERFPHLYGPLNLNAVLVVIDLLPDHDGRFGLPSGA